MNTRMNAARRLDKEVANLRDPLHDVQVPQLEENANVDQSPVKHPPMTEAEMRAMIDQMTQAMTTQEQARRFKPKL